MEPALSISRLQHSPPLPSRSPHPHARLIQHHKIYHVLFPLRVRVCSCALTSSEALWTEIARIKYKDVSAPYSTRAFRLRHLGVGSGSSMPQYRSATNPRLYKYQLVLVGLGAHRDQLRRSVVFFQCQAFYLLREAASMSESRAFSVVPFVALAARDDGDEFILAVEAVFSARPHTSTADQIGRAHV